MTDFKFVIHRGAQRDLDSAPADTRRRIKKKLEDMVTNEWRDLTDFDVEKIRGSRNDLYRTRVGDWRIVFALIDEAEDADTVTAGIVRAGKRDGVYQDIDQADDRADDL